MDVDEFLLEQLGWEGPPHRTQRVRRRSFERRNAINLVVAVEGEQEEERTKEPLCFSCMTNKAALHRPQFFNDVQNKTVSFCPSVSTSCSSLTRSIEGPEHDDEQGDGGASSNSSSFAPLRAAGDISAPPVPAPVPAPILKNSKNNNNKRELCCIICWSYLDEEQKDPPLEQDCNLIRIEAHENKMIAHQEESRRLFWSSNKRIEEENDRKKILLAQHQQHSTSTSTTKNMFFWGSSSRTTKRHLSSLAARKQGRRFSLSNLVHQYFAQDDNEDEEDVAHFDEERAQQMILASLAEERESSNIHRYISNNGGG